MDDLTRLAKALSHPLRASILVQLNERVTSPVELARELGAPVALVSYHVKTLVDLDCAELVRTEQRRGAIEHFYRATRRVVFEGETWGRLPSSAKHGLVVDWLKRTVEEVSQAVDAGGFEERDDVHFSSTRVELTEEGWQRLSGRLRAVVDEALELHAAGITAGNGDAVRGNLVLALHTRPEAAGGRAA